MRRLGPDLRPSQPYRERLKKGARLPISDVMSLEAVIGRIDSILQLQQQVLDPGATLSSSLTGGAGVAAASSTGATAASTTAPTTTADFASLLANAQAASDTAAIGDSSSDAGSGVLSSASDPSGSALALLASQFGSASSTGTGALTSSLYPLTSSPTIGSNVSATSSDDPRFQAMVQEANSLVGKPYVWGGGHSNWSPQQGYDCSGFVSAVLHAGGYLSSPQDTVTLPNAPGIEAGPGQYVTIYDRDESGQEGHVIIDLGGQFYESGGESGPWGGGGGVERIGTPSAAYLATFNDILHPAGL